MKNVINEIEDATKTAESAVAHTEVLVDHYRRSIIARFPVVFSVLVGFGASATFYGFERIIGTYEWLNTRPWLIVGVGLLTLALTGKLYKKLGE